MQEMYKQVAEVFAQRIKDTFVSEDTMSAEFAKQFSHLKFNRTDHGSTLIWKLFRDCWIVAGPVVKSEPTGFDKLSVLRHLHSLLDYNLFTQVLLNLQAYVGMVYAASDAEEEIGKLKGDWPEDAKLNPFEPKVKMIKLAATEEEKKYNMVLSTLRSLKIIAQFTPHVSFRVSPIGSTPAFSDSRNLSMLGIGADKYLKTLPELKPFYIYWEPNSSPIMAEHQSDGGFKAEGIPYSFYSKSGGDILQEVLFSRKIMAEVFAAHDITSEICTMIPRMNSVLVVTYQHGLHIKKAFDKLKQVYPMIELIEGSRT